MYKSLSLPPPASPPQDMRKRSFYAFSLGVFLTWYWGQNSFGVTNASDTALWQQPISYYCNDDAVDVFPIAFLTEFFGTGDLPVINLGNTCNIYANTTFPGTELLNCSGLADDITTCQTNGKIVTISLGGATGADQFTSDDEAATFAETIWNLFLGGSFDTRPFGDVVLDGVDLDIENGTTDHFSTFISTLRSYFDDADEDYYVTGAPQCVYPDAVMGTVLNNTSFDAVYVQFYNNECGLQNADNYSYWDFGIWDYWARNVSINSDVKIYIGAPAAALAANSGYVDIDSLSCIAVDMRKKLVPFIRWPTNIANDRYDLAIKSALTAAGGTGFTYPACTAADYVSGQPYTAGEQVTYDGSDLWMAQWWTYNDVPGGA
ncbi:glycoside hydrolase family 18 protein [Fistulina hepatica ATCC 64428]|uniref:chitinase n=1 Tax=Fistulina hepatica ATCC 64428 TaxID=1128425 RepID=A0A0D7AT31_9AGAR|nr:glycoside hydrolase family 18 protein [Fistulina hepatica ATCC 64428]